MFVASLVGSTVALIGEQADRDKIVQLSQELSLLETETLKGQIEEVRIEMATTIARLNSGIGLASDNRSRLDQLRDEQRQLAVALENAQKERLTASLNQDAGNESENPLRFLAQVLGIKPEIFRLAYTFFLALLCDVGGLATGAAAIKRDAGTRARPALLYLVANQTCHILEPGSKSRTACARAYHGDIVEIPTGRICPDCERSLHA